jgi:hypothetical protein
VLSFQSICPRSEPASPALCAKAYGFSLHAGLRCGAEQRQELEQLCRYITRPTLANGRLRRNRTGDVVLRLKSPYQDATTHVVISPLEFMQRLAALVPRPRLPLISVSRRARPACQARARRLCRVPWTMTPTPRADHAGTAGHSSSARITWARLLARVFQFDLEHCPHCGGTLKILAAIEDPAVIVAILTHLGLPAQRSAASPSAGLAAVPAGLSATPRADAIGRGRCAGIGLRWHSPAGQSAYQSAASGPISGSDHFPRSAALSSRAPPRFARASGLQRSGWTSPWSENERFIFLPTEIRTALSDPGLDAQLATAGMDVAALPADRFDRVLRAESAANASAIKRFSISAD